MSDLEAIHRAVETVAASDDRILAVYLFGSRTDGSARPDSDVDLGVLFQSPSQLDQLVDLQMAFEQYLGKDVDLIDLGRANAFLTLDAIRGERLYCRDPFASDNFELYVLRRAADLAPFERQRRRLLLGFGA